MSVKRLLVVDDEPAIGEAIGTVGEELGFEVEVTSKPQDFKRLYPEFEPTVVCLDVVMPDIDGIELLRFLSERKCTARIIVISGFNKAYLDSAHKLGQAFGLESVTTLSKPFQLTDLRNALSKGAEAS
ncbi:MAG: response regulator [Alphaproteobacteria bacterium]|jgi:DNA-binding response OmpR family regulator|nr:response regulator [Alphaproteobacteria bacterium]